MSTYPDGSTRLQVSIDSPQPVASIPDREVRRVVCHRINDLRKQEEFLVEWRSQPSKYNLYSWHVVPELAGSLRKVQRYLEALYNVRQASIQTTPQDAQKIALPVIGRKRKSPDESSSVSPAPLSPTSTSSSAGGFAGLSLHAPAYNGTLKRLGGVISITPWPEDQCFRNPLPTREMENHALDLQHQTPKAEFAIRNEFTHKLLTLPGPPIALDGYSSGAPPLEFVFVTESILREGVYRADAETIVGCGVTKHGIQVCRPHMGQNVGCEYSRVCDCLEFAPVDEARLNEESRRLWKNGETMGIPKRFPYSNPSSSRPLRLIDFYLNKRATIYECNPRCRCGPYCKTRVVQKGRQIPLEIFKTAKCGWGLRSPDTIFQGQFIDTYRGEIITSKEADARVDKVTSKGKMSYLYDLDKNVLDEDGKHIIEDFFVVDGEKYGGPTRFINHSCQPNVGQYVVSLNKYDERIYELAFFALTDIPANTELTFDYLDRDDDDDAKNDKDDKDGIRCYCGAPKCRKWLWR